MYAWIAKPFILPLRIVGNAKMKKMADTNFKKRQKKLRKERAKNILKLQKQMAVRNDHPRVHVVFHIFPLRSYISDISPLTFTPTFICLLRLSKNEQ